jgi:signal transduction histidine kinase
VGIGFVDTLALRGAGGQDLLLAYGSGANNGNTLGGIEDTGSWLLAINERGQLERSRQVAYAKSLRALVYPDRRRVLVGISQVYPGSEHEPNLLVWDSLADTLVYQGRVDTGHPFALLRDGERSLWADGRGLVRETRIEDPVGSPMYSIFNRGNRDVRCFDTHWLIWDGDHLTIKRPKDGRTLVELDGLKGMGAAWFDRHPGNPLPLVLILSGPGRSGQYNTLSRYLLDPVPLYHRWLAHPWVVYSLYPGLLLFLLLLGIRMFAQERLLRRLVPQTEQAVGLLDAGGRLVYANDLLEQVLAINHDKLPDPRVLCHSPQPLETLHDGRRLRWSCRAVPRRLGADWHQLLAEDITHQRENEQQRLFLMKLGVMAHDLKSPLTPIRLQAEGLEDLLPYLPAPQAARLRHSMVAIDEQVERSLQLITRFMGMARTDFELSPVSLPDIARAALAEVGRSGWTTLETRLDGEDTPGLVVSAESEVLELAVAELLHNAAQAMGGRGCLQVCLTADAEFLALTVLDEGPGIPPENLAKVLEPGYTTRPRGTGFGLYFVNRVLERMGARLELANRPGGGLAARILFSHPSHNPSA